IRERRDRRRRGCGRCGCGEFNGHHWDDNGIQEGQRGEERSDWVWRRVEGTEDGRGCGAAQRQNQSMHPARPCEDRSALERKDNGQDSGTRNGKGNEEGAERRSENQVLRQREGGFLPWREAEWTD